MMTDADPHLAPHWSSAALITIDMQNDFLTDGAFGVPGTTEVVDSLGRLAEAFREAGRPIVHIVRLYPQEGGDVDRVRRTLIESGAHFVTPGTPGRLLAAGLTPAGVPELNDDLLLDGKSQLLATDEYAVYKPRWGAFYRTSLATTLAHHHVDTLVFAGCNLPNCPRASIIEAHERDFRVVLVRDAVSQASDQGFREIAGLGTTLLTTAAVVEAVTQLRRGSFQSGRGK
jgi:nicotinamidase-related amidase